MSTLIKRFESVSEMVRFLNKPITYKIFPSENGDIDSWNGVASVAEADELLQHGYKVDINDKIITPIFETSGQVKVNTLGIVGYAPHVPNAINGLPLCMRNKRKVEQKNKVVDLYYNATFKGNAETSAAKIKGEKMVQIIREHESKGIRINLYVVSSGSWADETYTIITKFKDAKHPLNIGRLYYPLMHMAYLRVHMMRIYNRFVTNDIPTLCVVHNPELEKILKIDGQKKILI